MIIVKLSGGLGNQMFQYAAAKKIAHLNVAVLKSDLSEYKNSVLRKYGLGCFELDLTEASEKEMNKATQKNGSILKAAKTRIINLIHPYQFIKQPSFYFQYYAGIEKGTSNTYLEGYWQSEKYFKSIETIIRKDFTFKEQLTGNNKILSEQILNANSVSVHIRRGDYVTNDITNQFHGECTMDYYKNSINYFQRNIKHPSFYIFSDDPDWVKKNLKIQDAPVVYVNHNLNDDSYLDMRLMSICKHNIIANSSFSWWGAWLNLNPDKIVVAPRIWFNTESRWFLQYKIDTSDILPENWIKL